MHDNDIFNIFKKYQQNIPQSWYNSSTDDERDEIVSTHDGFG